MAIPRWITAPVGAVASGVGTAYDYATPGTGSSTLTNAGKAISNPNVVYTGNTSPAGILDSIKDGQNNFSTVQQSASGTKASTGGSSQTAQSGSNQAYLGDNGTSASDAQDRAMALFGIDQGLNSANDALGRLDNQAATGYANIDRSYQDAYNRLQAQQQIADRNYNTGRTNTINDYLANRTNVETNARNWLDAARRTLGAQGAGGGSAARYGVAYDAQQQAAQGNAAAQATNNKNIIALDQSYQDNKDQIGNNIADIQRQREQGVNDYRSQIENQRATLLDTIAQLTGQRTIANGGNFQAAQAAAAPYTSRIQGILNTIDGLAATPAVREQQVNLSTPDLAQYNWAQPATSTTPAQDPTLSDPSLNVIYGPYGQDQQQNPVLSLFGLTDPNQRQYA